MMVEVNMHNTDPTRAKALELALEWYRAMIANGHAPGTYNNVAARKITEVAGIFHNFLKQD